MLTHLTGFWLQVWRSLGKKLAVFHLNLTSFSLLSLFSAPHALISVRCAVAARVPVGSSGPSYWIKTGELLLAPLPSPPRLQLQGGTQIPGQLLFQLMHGSPLHLLHLLLERKRL